MSRDALAIRTLPADPIYVWEVAGDRNLYSAVLQNIAIISRSESRVTLQSVITELVRQNDSIQTRIFGSQELERFARYMHEAQQQGMLSAYDFVFRPDLLLGDDNTLAPTTTLAPGQALFLGGHAFLIPMKCDGLRITAIAEDDGKRTVQGMTELRLMEYRSKNTYRFPVHGTWYVSSGANLFSGHRWVVCQEFGLDLIRLGDSGGFYAGNGSKVENHYAYGSEVLAAADGIVVKTVDRFADSSERLPQENETNEIYWKRLLAKTSERPVAEAARAAGNHVLIRHDGEEHSLYGHLQPSSICVEEGEHVRAGQVIGRLGHSGNSPFPHLHFHVCDGEDFMYARVLPIRFSNVAVLQRPALTGYLHTGDIVSSY
jgi:murein DD-endopeptidase MepM/ murein hydrolase activator NlpD